MVYYTRIFPETGTYDLCELKVRTIVDDWFCGVDKKDKRAYLLGFNEIEETVFDDRKIALKRVHNAEKNYKCNSNEIFDETTFNELKNRLNM